MKTGFCSIREISTFISVLIEKFSYNDEAQINNFPVLSKLLYIGQILQLVILSGKRTEKKKLKIELTVREDIVNQYLGVTNLQRGQMIQCSIKDIEDYGYLVNIGIHGIQGFIKEENKKRYILGQPVYLQIKSILQDQNLIILGDSVIHPFEFVSKLHDIRPGMKVQLKCVKILTNGIFCTLIGSTLDCTIHADHVGERIVKEKDIVAARILFINYQIKAFGASLLTHIVRNYEGILHSVHPGSFYDATYLSANKMGLSLKLNSSKLKAHCHLSHLGKINLIDVKKNLLNKKIRCKVLRLNLLDRCVQVTLRLTKNLPISTFRDVKIGTTLTGMVCKVSSRYILIELSQGIRGIMTTILSRFTFLNDLTKKYKLKQFVKVIVLSVKEKKIEFSDKSELINLTKKVLEHDVTYSSVTKALVINTCEKGIKLLFFNKVKGFIKKEQLLKLGYTEKFKEAFYKGQVVDCEVLRRDLFTNIIICTLNIKPIYNLSNLPSEGSIIKAKIISLGEQGIMVYTKKSGFRLKGLIPYYLVSDHKRNSTKLCQLMRKKQILKVLILQKLDKYLLLTSKKSLVSSVRNRSLPYSFKQVCRIGIEIIGYVINIDKVGIFIRFLGNLTGLIKWVECDDYLFGRESNFQFFLGQTVKTKIIKFDRKKHRFYLTMHTSQAQKIDNRLQIDWTLSCFEELLFLTSLTLMTNTGLLKFSPSTVLKTKVGSEKSFGFTSSFEKEDLILGLALRPRHANTKQKLVTNERRKGVILDVNETKIIDISYRSELLCCKPLVKLPLEKKQIAIIEMIREDYVCLFFPNLKCIGFASTSMPNINFESRRILRCGDIIRSEILCLHKSGRLLCTINLLKLYNYHMVRNLGTRNWKFIDKNLKCFTDLKKKISFQAKVVLKTSLKLILQFGQNLPVRGFIKKTQKIDKFNSVSIGDIILVEISSKTVSFSIKLLKCSFSRKKIYFTSPFMSIIDKVSVVGLTIKSHKTLFVPLLQLSQSFTELKSFLDCVHSKKKHEKFTFRKKRFFIQTSKQLASAIIEEAIRKPNFTIGCKVLCIVKKIVPQLGIIVELSKQNKGFIHITNLFSKLKSFATKEFLVNDLLKVRIIGLDKRKNRIILSRRHVSLKQSNQPTWKLSYLIKI